MSIPVDLSLDGHGIVQVYASRARVRGQLKSGVSRQMYVDPTGTGLQFPSRGLLAFHLNSAASRAHSQATAQARGVNGAATSVGFKVEIPSTV